jgi:hypothetical protein
LEEGDGVDEKNGGKRRMKKKLHRTKTRTTQSSAVFACDVASTAVEAGSKQQC